MDGDKTFTSWCSNSGVQDVCVCDEPCKGNGDEFCGGSENFPIQTLTLTVEPAVVKITYDLEVVGTVSQKNSKLGFILMFLSCFRISIWKILVHMEQKHSSI